MSKDSLRTFIAVELSDGVRKRIAELIKQLRATGADVKWVEPHNIHLTLKFLGDVPLAELGPIEQGLASAAAGLAPFELEIFGAGAFPNAGRPRTLWLGVRDGKEQLGELAEQVERRIEPLGYPREHREFKAHATIGRVRKPGPGLRDLGERLWQLAQFDAGRTTVEDVVLFSSELGREGPTYEALCRAPLGG